MKRIIQMFNETSIDSDVIYYGFQVLMFNLLAIALVLLMSFLADSVIFGVCFIFCFACFRIPAGGFHCKTPENCILLMVIVFFLVIYLQKYVLIPKYVLTMIIYFIVFRSVSNKQKHILIPSLLMIGYSLFSTSNFSVLALNYAYLIFQACYYIRYHVIY